MKKSQHVGHINPNAVKSRDLIHLQEITHGSGAGYHKGKRDIQQRQQRRAKQRGWRDASPDFYRPGITLV